MMKHVKLLGLIAMAAMALMALLGVATASATVLCKTATGGLECGASWKYSGTIKGTLKSGSTAALKDTSGSTQSTCTGATAEGSASAGGEGVPVTGKTTGLSLSGCSSTSDNLEGCEGELESISETSNGTGIVKGCKTTTMIFGVSCTYSAGEGIEGLVEEGGSGEAVKVSKVTTKVAGGFLCPSTAVLEAEVVRTSPEGALGVAPS